MESQTLTNWIQIIAGIAVLAGLGLVVWELQQTRELVSAELAADGLMHVSQQHLAVMGEGTAKALANACDDPASLTTEEMIVLSSYYAELINRMRRVREIASRSDVYLGEGGWQRWRGNFNKVFETDFGRWWWLSAKYEPDIKDAGDKILEGLGPVDCASHYSSYTKSVTE